MTAVIHLFLFANATSTAIFIVEACILGICFGGIMAIMPSVCADAYGPGNAGQNYGFMFIGYTLASFIGPVVSANALATTGSYSSAFPFLGALCIVGLVLLSLAWMFFKKMKAKDAAEA